MRKLNVWNPGAKKDIVECHTENREVFLGPGFEGHGTMKEEACKKDDGTEARASPLESLLQ